MAKCLKSLHGGSQCILGRIATADVLIRHNNVSGKHCCIEIHKVRREASRDDPSLLESSQLDSSQPDASQDPQPDASQDPQPDSSQHETLHKLENKTKYCLKCTITDYSSNGTWISCRTDSSLKNIKCFKNKPFRLKKNVPTDIKLEDVIMLLAPSHSDSMHYCYVLSKGVKKGEIVLCQVVMKQDGGHSSDLEDAQIENREKKLVECSNSGIEGVNRKKRTLEERGDVKEDEVRKKASKPDNTDEILTRPIPIRTLSPVPFVPSLSQQLSEEQCPKCNNLFSIIELVSHVEECDNNVQCQYCHKLFPVVDIITHECPEKKTMEEVTTDDPIERCMMCFCDFPISELVTHSVKCRGEMLGSKERFKDFLPSIHDVDALTMSVLTPTQQQAVDYVRETSRTEACDHYADLCMRVIKLGYTPKDLQRVLQWVRHDAPIIIHLNLDRVLNHLIKDTQYRNLFEIGSGSGSCDFTARRSWEDNIFNNIYKYSRPEERVKYGVLNIVGDPQGVRCCYSYGDSFIQLKKVRLRTTFASMDTSSSSVKLSCCEHYGNVLNEYSDPELRAILDVATHRKPYMKSTMISHYKEIQIHGPVSLSENVDCIVVSPRHRGNHAIEKMLDKFVDTNKCNLIWMDEESDTVTDPGWGTTEGAYYDDDYSSDEYSSSPEPVYHHPLYDSAGYYGYYHY